LRKRVGHPPDAFPTRIGEVEARRAELVRIAICPKREEGIARVEWTPGVAVVEFTLPGQVPAASPRPTLILARPQHHLASRSPLLRAHIRGRNDEPFVAQN